MSNREKYCLLAKTLQGTPYMWGGKGDSCWVDGKKVHLDGLAFDCSGFVCHCLLGAGGPDWRMTHAAQTLFDELPPTTNPLPGDLAFYGAAADSVSHVMIVTAGGGVIGASGGGSGTNTVEIASSQHACVKAKPRYAYRPDFLGFRSLAAYLGE